MDYCPRWARLNRDAEMETRFKGAFLWGPHLCVLLWRAEAAVETWRSAQITSGNRNPPFTSSPRILCCRNGDRLRRRQWIQLELHLNVRFQLSVNSRLLLGENPDHLSPRVSKTRLWAALWSTVVQKCFTVEVDLQETCVLGQKTIRLWKQCHWNVSQRQTTPEKWTRKIKYRFYILVV